MDFPKSASTPINSASWVCSEIGNIDSLPSGFCEIHFITVILPSFARSLLECLYNESLYQGAGIEILLHNGSNPALRGSVVSLLIEICSDEIPQRSPKLHERDLLQITNTKTETFALLLCFALLCFTIMVKPHCDS